MPVSQDRVWKEISAVLQTAGSAVTSSHLPPALQEPACPRGSGASDDYLSFSEGEERCGSPLSPQHSD